MTFPDDVPTLTSGDVTLRAHRIEDAAYIVEQCTDPVSVRWTTVPLGYDHAMAVDWVTNAIPKKWESGAGPIFAIETTHPDGQRRFSGSLSLRLMEDNRAEIAFGAHPAVRGRGVMTTAVNLLLDYGFTECGLETVIWLANVGNLASRRVAWKTGFSFGGVLPRWLLQRGESLDAWVGTLNRSDERSPTSAWFDVPVIDGATVRLRPFEEKDVHRIVEACADERAQYWLSFLPSPYTEQDALDYLNRTRGQAVEGSVASWAVASGETDELVGSIALHGSGGSREIGYWTHPGARGRGVMREAVSLLVRHSFLDSIDGGLGRHRLCVKAAVGNAASQYVATANGFTEHGVERQSGLLGDGSYADMMLFDLLESQWRSHGDEDPADAVPR